MVVPFFGGCNTLGASGGALSPKVLFFKIFVKLFWPPQISEFWPINWHRCVTICNLEYSFFFFFFFTWPVSELWPFEKFAIFGSTDESSIYAMKGRQFWCNVICEFVGDLFRWFKFTLKPPYTVAIGNFFSAIWDTSHWHFFVKFGLKTAWDIS